jgi:hypothetical protein
MLEPKQGMHLMENIGVLHEASKMFGTRPVSHDRNHHAGVPAAGVFGPCLASAASSSESNS